MSARYAIALIFLAGCAGHGPTIVDPDRSFYGLDTLTDSGDSPGQRQQLNIVLVHGMRADTDQDHDRLISELVSRLNLESNVDDPPERLLTASSLPEIRLDGRRLWSSLDDWKQAAPRLRIKRFKASSGMAVNFYIFDYWQALVNLKCRFIVAPDTRLIGSSDRSDYCRDHGLATPHRRLGAKPLAANKYVKSEIVEWGFADAIIATSGFRQVLRQAVREAMEVTLTDALTSMGIARVTVEDPTAVRQIMEGPGVRFAIITKSLGSYVLLDALADMMDHPTRGNEKLDYAENTSSAALGHVLCTAKQMHMLANQLPLLSLSGISVGEMERRPAAGIRSLDACTAFENLTGYERASYLPPLQVVAYHEPNDILTLYVEEPPTGEAQFTFTNVITSFADTWFPWLIANPIDAHTGHDESKTVLDFVAYGRGDVQPSLP